MDSRAKAAARIVVEMEKLSAVLWNILRPFGDILFELFQSSGNTAKRVVDGAGEREQRAHDHERDHSENNAVLGHRLALLAPAKAVQEIHGPALSGDEKLQHRIHLPSSEAGGNIRAHADAGRFVLAEIALALRSFT
jgi:hypothetical protein